MYGNNTSGVAHFVVYTDFASIFQTSSMIHCDVLEDIDKAATCIWLKMGYTHFV